jgi:hypothetical protein
VDGLRREQEALKRLATQDLGLPTDRPRVTVGQAATADQIAAIMALPVDPDTYEPIQDEDGNLLFVFGVSSWGGTDTFG